MKARVGAADGTRTSRPNRPEDVEVDPKTGDVYVALTNNSTVADVHGSVRRIQETGNDPEASTFTWEDYANGGQTGRSDPGEQGFSCVDNLVFDKRNDLWIVTDISTSSLNRPGRRWQRFYHANNALFYVPTDEDPEDRIAFRFANMPIEAEGTGPYFTPDEDTLFVNVQHPGELANVEHDERLRPAGDVHVLLAGRQQDGEPQPVDAEAVDGRDHAAEALRGRDERDPAAAAASSSRSRRAATRQRRHATRQRLSHARSGSPAALRASSTSSRTPQPDAPLCAYGRPRPSATPAMSRCAHGTSPAKRAQERRGRDRLRLAALARR